MSLRKIEAKIEKLQRELDERLKWLERNRDNVNLVLEALKTEKEAEMLREALNQVQREYDERRRKIEKIFNEELLPTLAKQYTNYARLLNDFCDEVEKMGRKLSAVKEAWDTLRLTLEHYKASCYELSRGSKLTYEIYIFENLYPKLRDLHELASKLQRLPVNRGW